MLWRVVYTLVTVVSVMALLALYDVPDDKKRRWHFVCLCLSLFALSISGVLGGLFCMEEDVVKGYGQVSVIRVSGGPEIERDATLFMVSPDISEWMRELDNGYHSSVKVLQWGWLRFPMPYDMAAEYRKRYCVEGPTILVLRDSSEEDKGNVTVFSGNLTARLVGRPYQFVYSLETNGGPRLGQIVSNIKEE